MRLKSFLQFFTRAWRKNRPIRNHSSSKRNSRLLVEMLENRELLAGDIPTILATGVLPVDGSSTATGAPVLQVQFSETMSSSAETTASLATRDCGDAAVTRICDTLERRSDQSAEPFGI